jgi:hypothetical protein
MPKLQHKPLELPEDLPAPSVPESTCMPFEPYPRTIKPAGDAVCDAAWGECEGYRQGKE